jgi:hypothetical protein
MIPTLQAKKPIWRDVALLWRVVFLVAFAVLNAWNHWTQWIAIGMAALSVLSAVLLLRRSRFMPLPLYAMTIYFICATVIDSIYVYVHNPALRQQPITTQIISWLPAVVIAALLVNCCLYARFAAHGGPPDQRSSKAAEYARSLVGRVAGGVLLAFGIGLSILAVWIIERQFTLRRGLQLDAASMVLGFSLIAVFCLPVGYRLFFQRPNRYGWMLSPRGWMVLAVSLIPIGLGLGAIAIWRGTYQFLTLPAVLGVLACICAIASRAAKRRAMKTDEGRS